MSIGGTIAGLAVVLMHYLGQFGIENYSSVYNVGYVVGSVVIAVVASNVALVTFFVLRAQWAGTWWKRVCCGFVLAGVCIYMSQKCHLIGDSKDANGGNIGSFWNALACSLGNII